MTSKEECMEERDKIVKGLEETYRRLVEFKKRINSPMIIIKDGKVVAVDPHDVPPTIIYKRDASRSLKAL